MFQKAVSKSEIEDGVWGGNVGGVYVAVYLLDSGEVFASEGYCTHEQCMLAYGFVEGDEIECSCHGARFDIRSGRVKGPPAESDLWMYPAELRGDDVYVDVGD